MFHVMGDWGDVGGGGGGGGAPCCTCCTYILVLIVTLSKSETYKETIKEKSTILPYITFIIPYILVPGTVFTRFGNILVLIVTLGKSETSLYSYLYEYCNL